MTTHLLLLMHGNHCQHGRPSLICYQHALFMPISIDTMLRLVLFTALESTKYRCYPTRLRIQSMQWRKSGPHLTGIIQSRPSGFCKLTSLILSSQIKTNIFLLVFGPYCKPHLLYGLRRLSPDHSVRLVVLIIKSLGVKRQYLWLEFRTIPACIYLSCKNAENSNS